MNRLLALFASIVTLMPAGAQTLSLDSCRAMALRNNKQISISKVKQQIAANAKKVAKTKYLPHVDVVGGWMLSSKEVSILNDDQKNTLSNAGTIAVNSIDKTSLLQTLSQLEANKILNPGSTTTFGLMAAQGATKLEQYGNALGEKIVDAFRTDTRNIFAGSVILSQPLYMGGAITAANKMAEITEQMAMISTDNQEQTLLYTVDQAYWTVVSLNHKQKLANEYLTLVKKLSGDVHKMIETGVATRADGLKVDVRVNEAEMTKTQVDNGLDLAKMYLCQLVSLPLDSKITLVDENNDNISSSESFETYNHDAAIEYRPEVRLLSQAVELSKASTKLARASYLPQLALTAGYLFSNPNVYNGYEKKFGGMWTLGLMLRVPVLNWGEGAYKVRATKLSTNMATLELDEAKEKIELQITQYDYRLNTANKKLATAQKNIQRAEENLRCANVGFKEGVMQTTDVMAAQTAWLQAKTQLVDAEVDIRLAEAGMKKALGIVK